MHSTPNRMLRVLPLLIVCAHSALSASEIGWRFEAGGPIAGKPTVTDGRIYIAGGDTVHALTLSGEESWHRQVAGEVAAGVTVDGDRLFVHSSAGLHALTEDGEEVLFYDSPDLGPLVDGRTWGWGNEVLADPWGWYRSTPLVLEEKVVFGSSGGVHAVSKATGERLWAVPIGPVTADLVVHEDIIVAACWTNSVYGIDAATGEIRWRFQGRLPSSKSVDWVGYAGFHLTPLLHDGRVFVGTRGTYFFALDAEDGTEIWSSKVGSSWIGSPAVIVEDQVYYGLSDGFALMGYGHDRGAQTLFFRTASPLFAQPQLYGKELVFGTLAGRLFSLDIATGEGRQLMHLGPEENLYGKYFDPELIPDDLTRYQATQWSIDQLLTNAHSVLNLTIHEDTAYVGTGSGTLYAVELRAD